MAKILSVLELKEIDYSWTIKSFCNYLNAIAEHESVTISSKEFKVGQCENLTFYLKVKILSKSIICCYLYRSPNTIYSRLMGTISLGDNRDIDNLGHPKAWCEGFWGDNKFILDYSTHVEGILGYLVKLKFNATDIFTNRWGSDYKNRKVHSKDDLVVKCKLIIIDNDIKIQSVYTPQPSQLIKDDLKELLITGNNSDVIFEVDGDEIKAHKSILIARSPVFAAMFQHDMLEKNTNRVKIEDISKEVFELLLDFIYTDEINRQLDLETGVALLKAASKYQLGHLQNLCATQLFKLITKDNAMKIRNLAQDHNLPDFVKSIDAFIQSHRT